MDHFQNSSQDAFPKAGHLWVPAPTDNELPTQALGYAETGIPIPQPPRRKVRERRVTISFFFTSEWDVEIKKA